MGQIGRKSLTNSGITIGCDSEGCCIANGKPIFIPESSFGCELHLLLPKPSPFPTAQMHTLHNPVLAQGNIQGNSSGSNVVICIGLTDESVQKEINLHSDITNVEDGHTKPDVPCGVAAYGCILLAKTRSIVEAVPRVHKERSTSYTRVA
uniref:Uncharacterized protein n=1 Tax=Anopheles culicifacies TaxID=139723 RepID=A0A182M2R1_9DIPT